MRAVWFIGKFELLLNCTKHPNYSPKSRTPQQPQHVSTHPKKTTTVIKVTNRPQNKDTSRTNGTFAKPHKPTHSPSFAKEPFFANA